MDCRYGDDRNAASIHQCKLPRGARWTGQRITRGRIEGHHEDFVFEDDWMEPGSGAKCMDFPFRGTVEWEYTMSQTPHELHAAAPCEKNV